MASKSKTVLVQPIVRTCVTSVAIPAGVDELTSACPLRTLPQPSTLPAAAPVMPCTLDDLLRPLRQPPRPSPRPTPPTAPSLAAARLTSEP